MWTNSTYRIAAAFMAACAALVLAACGGDDGPAPQQGTVIGAAGGTVTGPNGAMVVIPPGALASDTTIGAAQSAAGAPAVPGSLVVFGQMYEFTPHGTAFALPVTVTVPFDPSLVPVGQAPLLYKSNALGQWEVVPKATVNATTVEAAVNGFSWFFLLLGGLPEITIHPANMTAAVGSDASTSCASNDALASYAWQVSPAGAAVFSPSPGQITATLNLAAVQLGQSGNRYLCRATNAWGFTDSNSATLTVQAVATGDFRLSLTLTNAGSGLGGAVMVSPERTACTTAGGQCSWDFAAGTQVTLTLIPYGGSSAGPWVGCNAVPQPEVCQITMNADRNGALQIN